MAENPGKKLRNTFEASKKEGLEVEGIKKGGFAKGEYDFDESDFDEGDFDEGDFDLLSSDSSGQEAMVRKPSSYFKDVMRSFRKNKLAVVSLVILCLLIIMVIVAPMMTKYDYFSNDYNAINNTPNAKHWFGTDKLGRDLWTRVWVGGRVSLLIAILATIIPYAIGMTVGGISGYFGGKVDMVIMRAIDVLMGIPDLIYMILLMMILGSGNILTLVIAMTITGWMSAARTTRGLVLQFKSRDFVVASETLGASPLRQIFKHLIPNSLGILIVGMTMTIPSVIFYEAFLSFIGLGITPPNPSWGQLIKNAVDQFRYNPYQFLIPCSFVSLTMLCFNFVGDGLRDALDPKLRA
ncbi:MAG: oppC [Anaerocolumna sp.]|jgi:oligopeptide transport system permease protein|nr:oppC [Anaerocolumna sp.]